MKKTAAFLLLLTLAACGPAPAPGPARDASKIIACRQHLALLKDIHAGILTGDEIRARIIEIESNARTADSLETRDAGRELLRAITTGKTIEEFTQALQGMTTACSQ
jgi:hypothetical protein